MPDKWTFDQPKLEEGMRGRWIMDIHGPNENWDRIHNAAESAFKSMQPGKVVTSVEVHTDAQGLYAVVYTK
jgi:hypothetical protein